MSWPTFEDVAKWGPKLGGSIFFMAGLLLFLPNGALKALGVDGFMTTHRAYIGLAFIAGVVFLATGLVSYLKAQFSENVRWYLFEERAFRKRLLELSPGEQKLLGDYLRNYSKTMSVFPNNGVIGGLEAANIVYRASQIGNPYFPYNLQPAAWQILLKEPQLVRVTPAELAQAKAKAEGL